MKIINLIIYFSMACLPLSGYAVSEASQTVIDLSVSIVNPPEDMPPYPRSPMKSPEFYLDGHTLSYGSSSNTYKMQILSVDGTDVVFEDILLPNTTSCQLPEELKGDYRIEISTDKYLFWGYISL